MCRKLTPNEITNVCSRARRMVTRAGGRRAVYIVFDEDENLHCFLSLHPPAKVLLATVGLEVVWV